MTHTYFNVYYFLPYYSKTFHSPVCMHGYSHALSKVFVGMLGRVYYMWNIRSVYHLINFEKKNVYLHNQFFNSNIKYFHHIRKFSNVFLRPSSTIATIIINFITYLGFAYSSTSYKWNWYNIYFCVFLSFTLLCVFFHSV